MTTSRTPPASVDPAIRGRRRVVAYSCLLLAVDIPLIVWLLGFEGRRDLAIVTFVGLLFLLGELFTVDIEFRHESQSLTVQSIPLVVGLLILPPAFVVGLRVVTGLLVFAAVHRQPPFKLFFNACSAALDVAVVAGILLIAEDSGLLSVESFGPTSWLVVLLAVIAGDAIGALSTTVAISAYQGRWEPLSISDLLLPALIAVADVGVAVVLVTLLQRGEPAAVLVLGIAAALVMWVRSYSEVSARYRRLQLLDGFTRAMGGSVLDNTATARLLTEAAEILHADHSWLIVSAPGGVRRLILEDGVVTTVDSSPLDHELLALGRDGARLVDADSPLAPTLEANGHSEMIVARLSVQVDDDYLLVVADRSGHVRPFDDQDLALFDTLAVHAGLALQNVGLVDQLRTEVSVTEHLATHDSLTALPNRTLFQQRLDASLESPSEVAVLLVDLDRFKEVNDTLGHHNGDLLLIEVGLRLSAALEGSEIIARLGGDEFAVLLTGPNAHDRANEVAWKLVAELERPFALEEVSVDVGASVGIATRVNKEMDGATLLRQADVAMYLAKEDHSSVELYAADRDHYSPQRLALVGRLRTAIEHRTLELHYQPQIRLDTGEVVGVEALIRWPQPGRTTIPPDEFIYVAEHTGLIHPLTQFVLEEAIAQAARWHQSGRPLRVSVNLSAYNLVNRDLVDEVARLLAVSGLPAELLTLELTETAVMSNPARSVAVMEALRAVGVSISIDDFGTGHSSLSYLTGIPATELKIDRSFVIGMSTDPAAETIVRTIVDLGKNLGLELVAEGVETEAHAAALTQMGCAVAQGYFYSRPLEVRGLELWMANQQVAPVRRDSSLPRFAG